MPMIPVPSELSDKVAEVLADCDAIGMQRPYVSILASSDGTLLSFRHHKDGSVDALAEHLGPSGMLMIPVSGMILDQSDRVLKILIDLEGVHAESRAGDLAPWRRPR